LHSPLDRVGRAYAAADKPFHEQGSLAASLQMAGDVYQLLIQ
jgi:hypothetical protein